MADTRGMGRCRLCSESPSNKDHIGSGTGVGKLVICGAWAHYMLVHRVTLQQSLRSQVLAIDPNNFSGETIAYRGTRNFEVEGPLRLFFLEVDEGIHSIGAAVDVELFNHLRELVKRCGGEVPPALPEVGENVVGGAAILSDEGALLQLLKQQLSGGSSEDKRAKAVQACRHLHDRLQFLDLSKVDQDAMVTLRQLIVATFTNAGFEPGTIRIFEAKHTALAEPIAPIASNTIGKHPGGVLNLKVYDAGADIQLYIFSAPSEYDHMR
ncbi:MAG: hypothetical protein AAB486_03380 [Patescibacteria group bacterium]